MTHMVSELTRTIGSRRHQDPDASESSESERGRARGSGGGQPQQRTPVKGSHIIAEQIDVGVPRQVAYDQWTTYEDLHKHAKKESADQKRDDRISFSSQIGPSRRHWDADVVEQIPGKRIAWRSVGGPRHMGVVTFHQLDDRLTRVMVQMQYDPTGFFETIGNFLRMQRRRVRKNLKLFKHFIEIRGEATGKGAGRVEGQGLQPEMDELVSDQGGDSAGRKAS